MESFTPPTLDQFVKLADRIMMRKVGMSIEDLPDTECAWDYWHEGMTKPETIDAAREYATAILDNEGYAHLME